MVHALQEIHRVLGRQGTLIDLRPMGDRWPVEVSSNSRIQQAGQLLDHEATLSDDKAANQAITQAASRGWFAQERQTYFPFFYYWDTPNEMKKYIEEEWEGFNGLDEQTLNTSRSLWASAGAEARMRVRMKMSITRWRKLDIETGEN